MISTEDLRGKLDELTASRDAVQLEVEKLLKNLNAHDGAIEVVVGLIEKAAEEPEED